MMKMSMVDYPSRPSQKGRGRGRRAWLTGLLSGGLVGFGVTLAAGLVATLGACGPSFQAIYEGNARFEHCYALEENPQVLMHDKAECWRDWSEHYTYGQTRDRVQYAIARYVALSQAPNVPTDEAMMMAAPGVTPRLTTITAPAPTNAFAPPPKTLGEMLPDAGSPMRPNETPTIVYGSPHNFDPDASTTPLPSGRCTDQCGDEYRACGRQCVKSDAGVRAVGTPCTSCETTYNACMRACFK
ncbi:hypothetical protein AKJ09_06692 [Labilithrix luteola]|uniref:Uncharacterized protein n=1 Tax=Labilithrix luteola TaxID=1391654 RepID=A0A0K1Q2N4_9BACT|nr:hypothetical protein [Labilithrix luteola]AKV00029.1 hypothetical protein AKJ09_06692 [Labilithrix luteola]